MKHQGYVLEFQPAPVLTKHLSLFKSTNKTLTPPQFRWFALACSAPREKTLPLLKGTAKTAKTADTSRPEKSPPIKKHRQNRQNHRNLPAGLGCRTLPPPFRNWTPQASCVLMPR